mmetsp:Transcript_1337/g.844  ORF Transcript_1337/g.844 Transcript_1337/m.844 type:complete len:183 (+) Transcript_1337:43-591(+)
MVFGEQRFERETQTDRVLRKHEKVGVNPEKLGIMREKETGTDPRMFPGGKEAVGQPEQEMLMELLEEDEEEEGEAEADSEEEEQDEIDEVYIASRKFKLEQSAKKRSKSEVISRVGILEEIEEERKEEEGKNEGQSPKKEGVSKEGGNFGIEEAKGESRKSALGLRRSRSARRLTLIEEDNF